MLTPTTDWVLAAPFRPHLRQLAEATGLEPAHIALLVGVPTLTVERLATPRPRHSPDRLRRRDAQRLFAHDADSLAKLARELVPATQAGALARHLLAAAPTASQLCGIEPARLERLARGELDQCPRVTLVRLQAAYLRLRARPALLLPRVGPVDDLEQAA